MVILKNHKGGRNCIIFTYHLSHITLHTVNICHHICVWFICDDLWNKYELRAAFSWNSLGLSFMTYYNDLLILTGMANKDNVSSWKIHESDTDMKCLDLMKLDSSSSTAIIVNVCKKFVEKRKNVMLKLVWQRYAYTLECMWASRQNSWCLKLWINS